MSANVAHAAPRSLPITHGPRGTAHLSKRAKLLKLELSERLAAARKRHRLDQHDVYERNFVKRWERADEPHAPNLLHLAVVGDDDLSRPYALEAAEWLAEKLREREVDPRQLDLFTTTSR